MPSYKLTYNYPGGKAGLARLLFTVSGTAYTDDKVDKPGPVGCPITQFPVLEIDGVPHKESTSFTRLLAKRFNLSGSNDIEQLNADALVEILDQLEACYSANVFLSKDVEKQREARKAFLTGPFKLFLNLLEKAIGQHGSNGHSAGSTLSWSDLYIHVFGQDLLRYDPNIFKNYPNIDKVVKNIAAHPKVAEFSKSQ